jgi:3-deoxy-D-arabino-heptulosonate 7-phosphate (DAHP) synthase class II
MRRYRVADTVAWVDSGLPGSDEPAVYATVLPSGPPLVMAGPARAIWLAVAEGGTADEVVARAADTAGAVADEIVDDVRAHLTELVRLGLVTRGDPADLSR